MTDMAPPNRPQSHDAAFGCLDGEGDVCGECEDCTGLRLDPLDTSAVLWVAAIDLLPIEERIAWVEKMKARVAEINAVRVTP